MKFNWFKKKVTDYPDYWNTYIDYFNDKKELSLNETRFVIFDTETTGFDIKRDRVLSIGAVSLQNNSIYVGNSFELYLEQAIFSPDTVKIHGLLKKGKLEKVIEIEAVKLFLEYIGDAVLVGHHIGYDIAMMNEMLQRHHLGELQNNLLDTGVLFKKSKHLVYQENLKHYSLDDLCDELNVAKSDRHTANGDALITAIIFQKIIARLNKSDDLTLKSLFK